MVNFLLKVVAPRLVLLVVFFLLASQSFALTERDVFISLIGAVLMELFILVQYVVKRNVP